MGVIKNRIKNKPIFRNATAIVTAINLRASTCMLNRLGVFRVTPQFYFNPIEI
jgi:hypothetical protein